MELLGVPNQFPLGLRWPLTWGPSLQFQAPSYPDLVHARAPLYSRPLGFAVHCGLLRASRVKVGHPAPLTPPTSEQAPTDSLVLSLSAWAPPGSHPLDRLGSPASGSPCS